MAKNPFGKLGAVSNAVKMTPIYSESRVDPNKRYFGQTADYFENDWLKGNVPRGQDWLYDYKGKPGERITDVGQIKALMKEGKIQTDVTKFMDYFMTVSGNHNKVEKWQMNDYRSASLLDVMGGYSKMGEWGPMRYPSYFKTPTATAATAPTAGPSLGAGSVMGEDAINGASKPYGDERGVEYGPMENPKAQSKYLDAFANYLAATNYELNIADLKKDIARKEIEEDAESMARLRSDKLAGKSKDDAAKGENSKQGFGVRFKRSLAGLSVSNMLFGQTFKGNELSQAQVANTKDTRQFQSYAEIYMTHNPASTAEQVETSYDKAKSGEDDPLQYFAKRKASFGFVVTK